MSSILNLETKDQTLNNVILNNPFYIDIKGSVNICLIRCGQEIEECNSINFSSMTNYGKMLVLNKSTTSDAQCAIKLAFDTSNDNVSNNGGASYTFEKVFFTVPSLHKLNGVVYDMETFIVFSSIQKNGNILYVCLCSLGTGTDNVQSGDWKLLNYKLMNELFTQKNIVPDIYGTNEINGVPNPIDLNNFIPKKGFRNFYDYTHPLNNKVNFRVFQNPLSVSNSVLEMLKSKLTPGNIYTNFKSAISQTINPPDGLFLYFSEDLTERYKSLSTNQKSTDGRNQNCEEKKDKISEDGDRKDKMNEEGGNKRDRRDKMHEENVNKRKDRKDKKDQMHEDNVNKRKDRASNNDKDVKEQYQPNEEDKNNEDFVSDETPHSSNSDKKSSQLYIIFIISFLLIVNTIYSFLTNKFFEKKHNNIPEEELSNYLNEMTNENMKHVLSSKFRMYFLLFLQFLFTLIFIFGLVISIANDNSIGSLGTLIAFIMIVCVLSLCMYFRYFYYRIKTIYDDNFTEKENYLFSYIIKESTKKNFFNIFTPVFSIDFSSFLGKKFVQMGGEGKYPPVPGTDDYHNSKMSEDKEILKVCSDKYLRNNIFIRFFLRFSLLWGFYDMISTDIVVEKLKKNKYPYYFIGIFILFLIVNYFLQSTFLAVENSGAAIFFISLIIFIMLFVPILIYNISNCYIFQNIKNYKIFKRWDIKNFGNYIFFSFLFLYISSFIIAFFNFVSNEIPNRMIISSSILNILI